MNSKPDYFPRLEPGESMLSRKRFRNLLVEATVYHQATNLQPPLDPPELPLDPAQPPAYTVFVECLEHRIIGVYAVKKRAASLDLAPHINAADDFESETECYVDYNNNELHRKTKRMHFRVLRSG